MDLLLLASLSWLFYSHDKDKREEKSKKEKEMDFIRDELNRLKRKSKIF